MTTFNMRLEEEVKKNFSTIAGLEGETSTKLVVEFMKKYVEEKVKENGLYSLYLMNDTVSDEEMADINNSIKNMSKEELLMVDEEIIEI